MHKARVTDFAGIGLARLAPADCAEERAMPRYRLLLRPDVEVRLDGELNILIHDISRDGIRIEAHHPLEVGCEISIELPSAGAVVAEVVHVDGNTAGAAFRRRLKRATLKAVLSEASVVWLPDHSTSAKRKRLF
jgi:hypothetical protein